ncbi:MAG: hypothetical protein WEF86_01915 [Gemmatimonadota bacterium]
MNARTNSPRWLAVLLGATLATGCDTAFEPFEENTIGPFSIFGYLDLTADTQWIRVTPIRQGLLTDPAPIDVVVTLEHLGTGRVVTLRDSVFTFADLQLDAVGYAHNFWTTERLEPEATYRLRALRSDGAATTALIEMPPELAVTLVFWELFPDFPGTWLPRQILVQADRLLYAEVVYTLWDPTLARGAAPIAVRQLPGITGPATWGYALPGVGPLDRLNAPPFIDVYRREVRVAAAGSDWPYVPGLSATAVAIPGIIPTTVENGVGSVLGVATWSIPIPRCEMLEPRPDGQPCTTLLDASSASIAGRVTGAPCTGSRQLPTIRLTERYADGGAVVWVWNTDWDGSWRFEGIEPDSDLLLEVVGDPAGAMSIPPLGPGEHYVALDVTLPIDCGDVRGTIRSSRMMRLNDILNGFGGNVG